MGLSFVDGKDRQGAAIYMLHDGSGPQERAMEMLKERLERLGINHQMQVFSIRDEDGSEIRDFYDVQIMPNVMIVRDTDEMSYNWEGQMPPAETIAYHARQISSQCYTVYSQIKGDL